MPACASNARQWISETKLDVRARKRRIKQVTLHKEGPRNKRINKAENADIAPAITKATPESGYFTTLYS